DDWWVSVRSSNTEPWLRVVIEADNETLLAEKRAAIETVLAEFVQ
ncbi:MAG: phosphomannomutase, partial [Verrucomicrobiota bacterium]|nr:phosphomannomutase [Verrucomicrobiota bacterium]